MINITYDPDNGTAVPDGSIDREWNFIMFQIKNGGNDLLYSTENIISRLRLGVVRNEISISEFQLLFSDKPVVVNEYGAIAGWPIGFCETIGDLSESILRGAILKKRAKPESA